MNRFHGILLIATVALSGATSAAFAQETSSQQAPATASAVVAATNSMAVLDDGRTLQKGDVLSYRVVEERKPPMKLVVTDSSEVEVPLIGRVGAAGMTCKSLAYRIKKPLEREYFYKATVIIGLDAATRRSRGSVYVTGQVRTQGQIEIPPNQRFTVSKAILKAGGLADFANKRKVKLVRKSGGSSKTIIVDLVEIIDRGKMDRDPVLQPDDMIIVPERLVNF
jgi:polysaccharide export outer membrane protein